MLKTVFAILATLFLVLGSCLSQAHAQTPLEVLAEKSAGVHYLLLGEEHKNYAQARDLVALLQKLEGEFPGRVSVVALEVFSKYQNKIDAYLASGNETELVVEGNEILRGYKNDDVISKNFLDIFRTVYALNKNRAASPIRIVAMDLAPDKNLTLSAWQKKVGNILFAHWVLSRDAAMYNAVAPSIAQATQHDKLVIAFVGSAHIQKAGNIEVLLPDGPRKMHPLGRLLKARFNGLHVNQNDPNNGCVDAIEQRLLSANSSAVVIDLNSSELGELRRFRCANEFEPFSGRFVPEDYSARDHYDLYSFYPRR